MLPKSSTYPLYPMLSVRTPSTPSPQAPYGDVPYTPPGASSSEASPVWPSMCHVVSHHDNVWRFHDPLRISRFFAANKYTCFIADGTEHILTESLTALERRLSPLGFMRTHRADLINLGHVRSIARTRTTFELTLQDGQRVIASRRLMRALRRRLVF